MFRVISWIVLEVRSEEDDPRIHTKAPEERRRTPASYHLLRV
jgi:hypothetical protein